MAGMQPISILLVEDDDVDVRAIQRAFRKCKINNQFFVAHNGEEALGMLRSGSIPPPHIVLLDLNMPVMGGLAFLKHLREDSDLHKTIVFVLTTSNADQDKLQAYEHHVAGYLLKTDAGAEFLNVLQIIENFQISVQFPPTE